MFRRRRQPIGLSTIATVVLAVGTIVLTYAAFRYAAVKAVEK